MNQSIHAVDLLLWFVGPISSLSAYISTVGHNKIEVEDNASAAIEFENGALGAIQGTTAAWPGFLKRLEILGISGSAIMDEDTLSFWKFMEESAEDEKSLNCSLSLLRRLACHDPQQSVTSAISAS